jgi:hypothetical protein
VSPLQSVILDPSEVSVAGRTEITLDGSEGVSVFYQGVDFGTQEVKQFMSEGLFGSRPIDSEWPLRTIKLPLVIRATADKTFDDARVMLGQWVALVNLEGGWLKRVLPSGRYRFADIVEAKLHLSASWQAENRDFDNEATLELQALPDLYGPVVDEEANEFTGDGAFTMQVEGDMPARVEEMRVEDLSGNDQKGLMWHYRRRNYSDADTARWAYDAEDLLPLDVAERVEPPEGADAYGTELVEHPNLSTAWTPVLSTGFLTHTGLYDVWARVYTASGTPPWLRLAYGVGDIVAPQENVQVQVPGAAAFYLVPLGQVNVRSLPFGDQRWEGVIQARGEAGGEDISIDRLWFRCADESSGVLAALETVTALASVTGSDSLRGEGALDGSEATRGGEWEESGAAGGFERSAEGAMRGSEEDGEGRTAILYDSSVGAVRVQCEVGRDTNVEGLTQGIYLRYFTSDYWVRVSIALGASLGHGDPQLRLEYEAGGPGVAVPLADLSGALDIALDAELDASGLVSVRQGTATYRGTVPPEFQKGGTVPEGKVGIFDYDPASNRAVTRTYEGFFAMPLPPADAVVYGGRAAYLSTRGMFRQSSDGEGAGPIGHPGADLPRLPVSGPGETPVEIAVKPSRGRLGELADPAKDKFKVQVSYRPCYAEIPES